MAAAFEHGKTHGEIEQLLKNEPPPGHLQFLPGGREVDGAHGVAGVGQLILPLDLRRQGILQLLGAVLQHTSDRSGQQIV